MVKLHTKNFPRYSPDGKYLAWFEAGLNVMEIGTQEWGALSGTYLDSKDRKTYNEYWNKNGMPMIGYVPILSIGLRILKIVAVGFEDWQGRDFK